MPVRTDDADEEVLATLGYKQEFKRAFTPFEVFGMAFNFVGLLPSLASVLSVSMTNGGAVSMVWGWALGSVFCIFIGMAMAELASSAPTSGGLYYMTYIFASPRTRNLLCWVVGYANTVGMVTGIASVDWGCTVQIAAAVNIASGGHLVITDAQHFGIYAAIVLSHAIVCSLGTRVLARLQTVYAIVGILLCLVIIIGLPIATPRELKNPVSYVFGNFTNLSGWPNGFAFMLGLLAPLWTICCYDSVIHISEESSNAAVAAPWGIIAAVSTAGLLGWVMNVMLALCMGPDLSSVVNSSVNQPMAQIFLSSFGQTWTLVLWSFVIVVQYVTGSSCVLVASRQSFALARDGALPLSNILYRMNAYTGTPVNTVLFDCLSALLIGLLALLGPAAVNAVFTTALAALYLAYIIPITSRFVFKNNFKPGPFSLGIWGAPVAAIAVAFMLFILVIFCFPSNPNPQVLTMNYTPVVFGGVLLLALGWYYFPIYGGVHWFQGPTFNVEETTLSQASVGLVTVETMEKDGSKSEHEVLTMMT